MSKAINAVRFRAARKAAGFKSQGALGKAVGLAEDTIGRIERGTFTPSAPVMKTIANAVHVRVASLYLPDDAVTPSRLTKIECELLNAWRGLAQDQRDYTLALTLSLRGGGSLEAATEAAKVYRQVQATRRQDGAARG